MVNLTISESIIEIKMVNLLNQLQANCWCHTSPLMQYVWLYDNFLSGERWFFSQ